MTDITVRELRKAQSLAQYQLAAACGLDASDLRKWERGLEMPTEEAIQSFSRYFGVSAEQLREAHRVQCRSVTAGEGYVTAQPKARGVLSRQMSPRDGTLRVLDLFCGAGGFSYGLEMTGAFAVTAGIDLLSDRAQTFAANHKYADVICGDIRSITPRELEAHALCPDIVVGGPPCQGFSSIRPFRGLTEDDARNNLFESFVLVVSRLQPKWFVLENVVGLLQHKRQTAFRSILHGFEELGYRVDWRVINAALYGVPQNRERVVIVGSKNGKTFQWPKPTNFSPYRSMAGRAARHVSVYPLLDSVLPAAVSAHEAIGDLPPVQSGESASVYTLPPMNDYQELMRGKTRKLTLHKATTHSEKMMAIIRKAGSNRAGLPEGMTTSGFSSSYSRLDPNAPSATLTVNFVHPSSNKCIHPLQNRALTPREGARLQGFPDIFEFCGTRSQIVKQIGNAVPPLLGRAIGEAIIESQE